MSKLIARSGVEVTQYETSTVMRDYEHKIGLTPWEQFDNEYANVVEQLKELDAIYGPRGTYGDLRKIELARIKALIRATHLRDNPNASPLPQGVVDDLAYIHEDFVAWVAKETSERATHYKLSKRLKAMESRNIRETAVIGYAKEEMRLTR